MSAESSQSPPSLEDFVDLFAALDQHGVDFVVIGGMAVGAYARLIDEVVVSRDLDICVAPTTLYDVLDDVQELGATIVKRPQARSIEVAFLDWRGLEVNILTSSTGLPAPAPLAANARWFRLPDSEQGVLVADPLDLLSNKLAVNRPKDQPHIAVLRRFIDDDIVHDLGDPTTTPRERIRTAARLLDVLHQSTLDESLAARLIPLATLPADYRFLAHRVSTKAQLDALAARAPADIQPLVRDIASRRTF